MEEDFNTEWAHGNENITYSIFFFVSVFTVGMNYCRNEFQWNFPLLTTFQGDGIN